MFIHYRNSRVCRQLKAVGEAPFTVGKEFADRISLFLSANPCRKKSCRQTGLCRQQLGRCRRPFANSHVVCRRSERHRRQPGLLAKPGLPTARAVGKVRVCRQPGQDSCRQSPIFCRQPGKQGCRQSPYQGCRQTSAVGKKYTALPTAMVKAVGKAGIFFCCFIAFESHL